MRKAKPEDVERVLESMDLKLEIEQYKKEIAQLENRNKELQNKIQKALVYPTSPRDEKPISTRREDKEEVSKLKSTVRSLENEIADYRKKIRSLEHDLKKSESNKRSHGSISRESELERQNQLLEQKVNNLKRENEALLEKELSLERKLEKEQQEVKSLRRDLHHIEQNYKKNSKASEDIVHRELNHVKDMETLIKSLKQTVEEKTTSQKLLSREVQDLKSEIFNYQRDKTQFDTDREKLIIDVQWRDKELEKVKSALESLKKQKHNDDEEIKRVLMQEHQAELKQLNRNYDKEKEQLLKSIQSLQQSISSNEKANKAFNEEIESLQHQLKVKSVKEVEGDTANSEKIQELKSSKEKLEKTLNEQESLIKSQTQSLTKISQEFSVKEQSLQEKIKALETEIHTLKEERQTAILAKEQEIAQLKEAKKSLEQTIETLHASKDSLKIEEALKTSKDEKEKLQKDLLNLQADQKSLQEQLSKAQMDNQAHLESKSKLEKEIQQIQSTLTQQNQPSSTQQKQSHPQSSFTQPNVSTPTPEIAQHVEKLSLLNKEVESNRKQIVDLSNALDKTKKEKETLSSQLDILEGSLKQSEESLQSYRSQNEALKSDQKSLSDKVIELQKALNVLKNTKTSVEGLSKTLEGKELEITNLKDENKTLSVTLTEKDKLLDEATQEMTRLNKLIADESMRKKRVSKSKDSNLQAQIKTLNDKLDAITKASESNTDLKNLLLSIDKDKSNDKSKSHEKTNSKTQSVILLQSFFRSVLTRRKYREDKQRYRKVLEIVETEQNYIDVLDLVHAYYFNPLKELIKINDPLVSQDDLDTIFCGIDKIREKNKLILSMLQERVSKWHTEELIGDIFIEVMENNLLDPHIEYIQRYNRSREFRLNLAKDNKAFGQFLKINRLIPALENRSFDDLLINPIQRIPRYILLLDNLLKSTKATHPDHYNIQTSLRRLQEFTSFLNENNRRTESMDDVNARLQGVEDLPTNPTRILLHEGSLMHMAEKANRYAFLFSDCIVFSKELSKKKKKSMKSLTNKSFEMMISIKLTSQVSVRELEWHENQFTFAINVQGVDNVFGVPNSQDGRFWVTKIGEALKKLKQEGTEGGSQGNKGSKRKSSKRSKPKSTPS